MAAKGTRTASSETEFEKRRGVNRVEVRSGFAQVHVSRIATEVMAARLKVLSAVASVGISIDFLKLTPSGMSFLVPEQDANVVDQALAMLGVHFTVRHDRSIVLVHAVSIRDEEGLIAGIVHTAIALGIRIDHVGDMHDRMLMVVQKEDAERLAAHVRSSSIHGETHGKQSVNDAN